jgi:iron complex outermembrane receptor protein
MGVRACGPILFHGDPDGTCASGMPINSGSQNTGLSFSAEIVLPACGLVRLGAQFQQLRLDDYWTASGGGVGMSINGIPFGVGVPGMGRSLYAGINYNF